MYSYVTLNVVFLRILCFFFEMLGVIWGLWILFPFRLLRDHVFGHRQYLGLIDVAEKVYIIYCLVCGPIFHVIILFQVCGPLLFGLWSYFVDII
jgi:hypothetical protein